MRSFETVLGMIALVVMGLLVLIFIIAVLSDLLAKEHPQVITVVRKRENSFRYRLLHGWSSYSGMHYAVECTYPDSDKLHNLVCNRGAEYEKLVPGMTYIVMVKKLRIMSIVKKHKRK